MSPNSGNRPRPTMRSPVAVLPSRSTAMSPSVQPGPLEVAGAEHHLVGASGDPTFDHGRRHLPLFLLHAHHVDALEPELGLGDRPAANAEIDGILRERGHERGGDVGQRGRAALDAPVPAVQARASRGCAAG